MKNKTAIIAFFIACLAFICCGNRGPLFLEPEKVPPPVQGLTVAQKGNAVTLEWAFPLLLSDGQTPIDLEKIGRLFVHYVDNPAAAERFAKKADLFAKIPAKELQHLAGRSYAVALLFKTKELKGRKYFFALSFEYAKKRSALSPVVAVDTLVPPVAIKDLALAQEKKTLVLRWSAPAQDAGGQPLTQPLGYCLYRAVHGEKESAPLRRLNPKPLPQPYYEDADLSLEGEYTYAVSTLLSPQVESEPSNRVKIRVSDTFAPDIPPGLVAFTGPDHVLLTWEPVADTDLSHYRLYRKDKENAQFKMLADNVRESQYKDFQTKKGQVYFYAISAIDRRGNESDLSKTVKHEFQ